MPSSWGLFSRCSLACRGGNRRRRVLQYTVVIVAVGCLLFAVHFLEILLWAYAYAAVGAAPSGTDLVYFAFGNYTTLGYGNVLPLDHWRLLAPMTALNGLMLIGWSTALIFVILRQAVPATEKR